MTNYFAFKTIFFLHFSKSKIQTPFQRFQQSNIKYLEQHITMAKQFRKSWYHDNSDNEFNNMSKTKLLTILIKILNYITNILRLYIAKDVSSWNAFSIYLRQMFVYKNQLQMLIKIGWNNERTIMKNSYKINQQQYFLDEK